mgnify:CR=1 FL=1
MDDLPKELTDQIYDKLREKFTDDLTRLMYLFKSMDYCMTDIKILVALLLATLVKTEKFDEEDIRDIFHGIKHIKERIVFKD